MAKKRKLSAYNRHIQREMKAGKTMKQAAASWKGKSSTPKRTKSAKPRKTRRVANVARKKTRRKSGFRLPGGVGIKGIAAGILGLVVAQRFVPPIAPGADKIAAGLGLRALSIGGGGPLAAVGMMELAGSFILPRLGGLGVSTSTNGGGYDY